MLPRRNKMTGKAFDWTRRRAKRFSSGDFTFLYAPSRGTTRAAVVVAKKAIRLATNRNRARRQTYALLQNQLPQMLNLNLICLYRGKDLPENTTRWAKSLREFSQFWQEQSKQKTP